MIADKLWYEATKNCALLLVVLVYVGEYQV